MRLVSLALAISLAVACSPAVTPAPAAPAVAGVTILASDGAAMRPIVNGGRVPLRNGWATIQIAPVPLTGDGRLRVGVFDRDGREVDADVSVDYSSLDMDHGHIIERGVLHERCYEMPLSFAMPGRWRLLIHVVRDADEDTVTLLLPEVGL